MHKHPEDVSGLVRAARGTGFKSISFDLIYGLPLQSVASFGHTLDLVIDMRPDRLAVYNYAHLPQRFKGQRMINDIDIPVPETKLEILHQTIDRLCNSGYEYIGMDHFALPDDELVRARKKRHSAAQFPGLFNTPSLRSHRAWCQRYREHWQRVRAKRRHNGRVRGANRSWRATGKEGHNRRSRRPSSARPPSRH